MAEVSTTFALEVEEYMLKGQLEPALALCLEGIECYPDYPMAYYILSKIYADMNEFDKSLEFIESSLEKFPGNLLLIKAREDVANAQEEAINHLSNNTIPKDDNRLQDFNIAQENNFENNNGDSYVTQANVIENNTIESENPDNNIDDSDDFPLDDFDFPEVEIPTDHSNVGSIFDTNIDTSLINSWGEHEDTESIITNESENMSISDTLYESIDDDDLDIVDFGDDDFFDEDTELQSLESQLEIDNSDDSDKAKELINPPTDDIKHDFHGALGQSEADTDIDSDIDDLDQTLSMAQELLENEDESELSEYYQLPDSQIGYIRSKSINNSKENSNNRHILMSDVLKLNDLIEPTKLRTFKSKNPLFAKTPFGNSKRYQMPEVKLRIDSKEDNNNQDYHQYQDDYDYEEFEDNDLEVITPTMAKLLANQGSIREAISIYNKLVDLEPENSDTYRNEIANLQKLVDD